MKKSILLLLFTVFLISTSNLYAKNNKDKGKSSDRGSKSASDRKDREAKNEKAVDAQKNWGKLKNELEYADKYEEKELKEEIKLKKRLTRIIKSNPDLGLSEEDIEQLISDYMATEVSIEIIDDEALVTEEGTPEDIVETPVTEEETLLDPDIEKALSKYKAALDRIESKRQEESTETTDDLGEVHDETGEIAESTEL
jgi:hypothetical protein